MKNLVFIGDSLTEWYNWQKRFPKYRITNLGISGEPVESLLDRLVRIRASIDDPDFIFLMTGTNNMAMEQHDITGPYREIVHNLSTWYKKSIVVIQSILPVALEWISNSIIRGTNRHLKQIALEFSAEYLDVYSLFIDPKGNPKKEYFQDDGVHLTREGYDVWASEVERFLMNI
ncbi:MAG TPA: GDSL-type esterase/lipase family protein [Nitrospirota bacterium]|nr:GDSL-type esterase/lipase family protein [Nitrospirota bacterium]